MNILVINSGSSSIKYQLFQMPEKKVICKGMVERIGIENGKIIYKVGAGVNSNLQPILKAGIYWQIFK